MVESAQMKMIRLVFIGLLGMVCLSASWAHEQTPEMFKDVGMDPVLGSQIPAGLEVVDESGKTVPLASFFDGQRPVALIFNYYECPMLCGLVLNSARDSFTKMPWFPGDHYRIVTISIDPKETSTLASAKKKAIVGSIKDPAFRAAAEKDWHFLVGKGGSEKRLADALGFRYKWNAEEGQWAHGAALFVLSPTGKLSRVLFGLDFPPRDLKLSFLEAGEGKVGTIAEKLMLFCYHYDPKGNKYAILASRLVSMGGAVTVLAMLLAYLAWFMRQRGKETHA
ncbi:MAG TPA: SCO family protein [Bdellovibrionota bacterium]|jgi:protein SCO1/2